jgi:hypothetical protein
VHWRAIGLALVLAVAWPGVAAAGSLIARSERTGQAEIKGVGCGVAASLVLALPASATAVRVREPKVGDTTPDSRLTEAAVAGARRGRLVRARSVLRDQADPAHPGRRPVQLVQADLRTERPEARVMPAGSRRRHQRRIVA